LRARSGAIQEGSLKQQQPTAKDRLKRWYFDTGFQYYLAGRFATMARLMPVTGNLFHHAVEFCLKGALLEKLAGAKLRGMSHDINKLWRRYKNECGDAATLSKFDPVISGLHQFESIRYPEKIASQGGMFEIGFGPINTSPPANSPPYFGVNATDIDELVQLLFKRARLNMQALTSSLHRDARRYLTEQRLPPAP
jgi:hypothetical protein